MYRPDLDTVFFMSLIITFICTTIVFHLYISYHKMFRGMLFWLLSFCLQTIGLILIGFRGNIPDLCSVILANLFLIGGIILLYAGLGRFFDKPVSQPLNFVLLALFMVVQTYFTYFRPDFAARSISISIYYIIFYGQLSLFVFRRIELPMRQIAAALGTVFIGYCAIYAVRLAVILMSPPTKQIFDLNLYETILLSLSFIFQIFIAYSLTLIVTLKLKTEFELQEDKFKKVFQSSPYALIITKLSDGKIIEANEGFRSISGYEYAEAVGKTTVELCLWTSDKDRLAVRNELASSGRVKSEEFPFRKKTGETVIGLYSAEIISVRDEKYVLSSIEDITKKKKAEEDLKNTKQKLEETLEDFYTMRIGMAKELKLDQVNSENKKIKKRLDSLAKDNGRPVMTNKKTQGTLIPRG
jgi:PAS domain S-box-containing protein